MSNKETDEQWIDRMANLMHARMKAARTAIEMPGLDDTQKKVASRAIIYFSEFSRQENQVFNLSPEMSLAANRRAIEALLGIYAPLETTT